MLRLCIAIVLLLCYFTIYYPLSITATKNQYKYYYYVQEVLYYYYLLKPMIIKCSDMPELCPELVDSHGRSTFEKSE